MSGLIHIEKSDYVFSTLAFRYLFLKSSKSLAHFVGFFITQQVSVDETLDC